MVRIVVDDERTHRGGGVHVRTSADAVDLLVTYTGHVDELWLDHDLGGDDTIRPVVDLLEELCFYDEPPDIGVIYVHTANPVGASMILRSRQLNRFYTVVRSGLEPFVD